MNTIAIVLNVIKSSVDRSATEMYVNDATIHFNATEMIFY